MAAALALTAARLSGVNRPPMVLATAFAPYAVVFYSLALLLLVPVLVSRRSRPHAPVRPGASWTHRGAMVVAAAGLVLHGSWLAPFAFGDRDGEGDRGTGEEITVMTANLRYGRADAGAVVALVRNEGVDVLALQEVTPGALEALEEAGIGRLLGYRAGSARRGVLGTMTFSRLRLTNRQFLRTRLGGQSMVARAPQGKLNLISVHAARPQLESARAWRADLARLRRVVEGLHGPVIVAGDFNATLDHQPLRALLDDGFADAAQAANAGWAPTWPSGRRVAGLPLPPLVQIDHVLVRGAVSVRTLFTRTLPGSDHRAVLARVSLP